MEKKVRDMDRNTRRMRRFQASNYYWSSLSYHLIFLVAIKFFGPYPDLLCWYWRFWIFLDHLWIFLFKKEMNSRLLSKSLRRFHFPSLLDRFPSNVVFSFAYGSGAFQQAKFQAWRMKWVNLQETPFLCKRPWPWRSSFLDANYRCPQVSSPSLLHFCQKTKQHARHSFSSRKSRKFPRR